jgi:hypothetical protein
VSADGQLTRSFDQRLQIIHKVINSDYLLVIKEIAYMLQNAKQYSYCITYVTQTKNKKRWIFIFHPKMCSRRMRRKQLWRKTITKLYIKQSRSRPKLMSCEANKHECVFVFLSSWPLDDIWKSKLWGKRWKIDLIPCFGGKAILESTSIEQNLEPIMTGRGLSYSVCVGIRKMFPIFQADATPHQVSWPTN